MTNPLRSLSHAILPATIAQKLQFRFKEPSRYRSIATTGDSDLDAILNEVDRDGFAVLSGYFSAAQCEIGIREFENPRLRYPCYVNRLDDDRIFEIESISSIARIFFEDTRWLRLANAYTSEPNTAMFAMGNVVRWDGTRKLGSGGGWHRDCFSRELKVIVYLSDVGPENGPLQILRRSHTNAAIIADIRRANLRAVQNRLTDGQVCKIVTEDPDRLQKITAPAGSAIVFDDSSIHTGTPITKGARYAFTNYFMPTRTFSSSNIGYYGRVIRAPLLLDDLA